MKTVLCITASCMITVPALSQSVKPADSFAFSQSAVTTNSVSLLDSAYYYYNWNSGLNDWAAGHKSSYTYNSFYKEDSQSTYNRFGTVWIKSGAASNYTYDSNHNILEKIYEGNSGGVWSPTSKEICTYDAANHMLTELQQVNNNGNWEDMAILSFTYTGNNVMSYGYQLWNTGTGAWDHVWRISYTYNTSDDVISQTDEKWVSGAWVNDRKSINYVYAGTDLMSYETELWNTTTAAYEPQTKTSNTYDGNHHVLSNLTLIWNTSTATWNNSSKAAHTYDAYGNRTSYISHTWNNTSGVWQNASKNLYYYRTGYVGINEFSSEKSGLVVHPNPANEHITVSIPGGEASTLTITDLSGKTVLKNETDQADHFSIDIRALEAGMYFMELKNTQGSAKGKFIKH